MAEWVARCRTRLSAWKAHAVMRAGAEFLLCLLFSCVNGELAPLGSAAAAACAMTGSALFPMLGALLGALLSKGYPQLLALALCAAAHGGLYACGKSVRASDKLLILSAAWSFTLPFFYFESFETLMLGFANLCLSLGAAVCLAGAFQAMRKLARGQCPPQREQLCLCGGGALFLFALRAFSTDSFSASLCAACFFSLLAAYGRGIVGVAAAVVFSAACVLAGAEPATAGVLAVCTLCAAGVRLGAEDAPTQLIPARRWGMAAAFVAAAFILYTFVTHAVSPVEAGAAALLAACLPAPVLRAILALGPPDGALRQAEATLFETRRRLCDAAEVLRQAAPLLESADGFAARQVLAVSEALCGIAAPKPPLRRRYGIRVGAAAIAKAGSRQTGDSMGMRDLQGRVLLLLSDGMGTGRAAHGESAAAVALLGDLLSIGIAMPEALECVNRLLLQRRRREGGDMFATMDALLFDRADAAAQFIKYGAPPSYILREGKLLTLYAEALPAGIVTEARPALHTATLRRGDAVVLMTDGAYDALAGDLTRAILEQVSEAKTPDEAAQALLLCAREKSGADDMSVLVAQIS